MSSSESISVYRKALQASVAALCAEAGFTSADKAALESLTEMLQSFLGELGRSGRAFAELSSRVEPIVGDVIMSLVEMGIKVDGIISYALNSGRITLPQLSVAVPPKVTALLQVGDKKPHPVHIPDNLPLFPDTHSYIKTPTHKQPITEYEAIREKTAQQKRDVEKAITKFKAKTTSTYNLFSGDDTGGFHIAACTPERNPYLLALLPSDCMDEEMSTYQAPPEQDSSNLLNESFDGEIDNPYLRPTKSPRKKKR